MAYSATCTHSYWSSWGSPSWGDSPVFPWLVILIGLSNSLSTSTFSETMKIKTCACIQVWQATPLAERKGLVTLQPYCRVVATAETWYEMQTSIPNSLIFSFLSVLSAPNTGWQFRYFTPKNSTNMMSGGSMLIIRCCRRAQMNAVQ